MVMDIHTIFGILAGIVSGAAAIPYIIAIIRNTTEPHPVTWWLWAAIGLITLLTYQATGAGTTMARAIVNFVSPTIIAILSIKYWDGTITRFDWICFVLSVLSLVVWLVSGSAVWGLMLSLLADTFAVLPTYRKLWIDPKSESIVSWSVNTVGNIFNVLAIKVWVLGIVILPLYLLVLSVSLVMLASRQYWITSVARR